MSHSFQHLLSIVPDEIRDQFKQNLLNYYLSLPIKNRDKFIHDSKIIIEEINSKSKNLPKEEKEYFYS